MLPPSLSAFLFSDPPSSLAGVTLGAPFAALPLPAWWKGQRPRAQRYAGAATCDGVDVNASAWVSRGRVGSVTVVVGADVCDDAVAACVDRFGRPASRGDDGAVWKQLACGGLVGEASVQRVVDGAGAATTELQLWLTFGQTLPPDPDHVTFDVDALAAVVASSAWPRDQAKAALLGWLQHDLQQEASDDERAAYFAVHDAALAERPAAKRQMVRDIVAHADVSDFDGRSSLKTAQLLAGVVARFLGPQPPWLPLSPADLWPWLVHFGVVDGATVDGGAAAVLADVIDAIAYDGDADARADARAGLVARLRAKPPARAFLPFSSAPGVVARAFGLLSAHLPDDAARLLWIADDDGAPVASAVVTFFDVARGLRAPHVDGDAWTTWLSLAKAHFPARFDDAVALWARLRKDEKRFWRATLTPLADAITPGPTSTTWKVGGHVFTHSGKETAGRWKIQRG